MTKKILITGGAGYIGAHTALALIDAGHDVVIVDNLCNSTKENIVGIECITGKKITFYQSDVRDKKALRMIFTQHSISAVIHFAGSKAAGESIAKPMLYYDNNVNSTINLIQVMTEFNCHQLIFSSSATVYGKPEANPIPEQAPLVPINPYGKSKVIVEQILTDLACADKQWSIVALRYFNPIGAHPSGLLGEHSQGQPQNLMPYIAQVAAKILPELHIFGDSYQTPDGTGVRDYVHVMDIANGHVDALKLLNTGKQNIFKLNLGIGKAYSVLEMVRIFAEVSDQQIAYKITDERPGDTATLYADPSQAQEILNWRAQYTIEQACADLWNWQKKQINKT